MSDRFIRATRADIGRIEVAVGGLVELALARNQNVDGALELDRGPERVSEPDLEIVRGRRHALLGDGAHGLFGHPGHVFEIQLVECVSQGRGRYLRSGRSFLVVGVRKVS